MHFKIQIPSCHANTACNLLPKQYPVLPKQYPVLPKQYPVLPKQYPVLPKQYPVLSLIPHFN